jgi:hypothetical protein
MKKIFILFCTLLTFATIPAFSQNAVNDFCKFTITAGNEIKEKLKVSALSIRGVPGNIANKILPLLNLKKGDELYVNHDSLCNKLKKAGIYKNYYLSTIEFYRDSITYQDGAMVRFKFEKINK